MISDIGLLAAWFALIGSVVAVLLALYGYWASDAKWITSARRAAISVWPLLTVAVLAIEYALLTDDFSLNYVASVSSREQPLLLKVTAL